MIRPLRKRHLQIWSLCALLLPLVIVAAVISRKPEAIVKSAPAQNEWEPVIIKEQMWRGNIIQLRGKDQSSITQLVWKNKEPLNVPSATLYFSASNTKNINAAQYIGRIEGRGDYAFAFEPKGAPSFFIILYDFIHQQVIDRIEIKQ
ncbi:MAG: hypothetical protein ICV53_19810 [Flavisolibacter sp.]|nr:hypothetical protein [Flavisolibacter sp.]